MFEGSGAPSQTTEFQSPTAYGSATNENVFLINGVDATIPRAGSFGSLVNVNYDAVEEVRIVAHGIEGRVRQLLRRGHRRADQVRQQRVPRQRSLLLQARIRRRATSPASNEDLGAAFLFVGEGEQLAGETKKDWEGSATLGGPIRKDKLWFFGAFNYLRNASLPPRWSLRERVLGPLCRRQDLGRALQESPRLGARTTTRTTTATAGAGARSRSGTRR